jgi:thioredoxin 1
MGAVQQDGTPLPNAWNKNPAPVVESLSKELRGKVAFGKLNTDDNQLTAMRHNIAAIPTLLIFKEGKLIDRIVGAFPKEQILRKLQKYL